MAHPLASIPRFLLPQASWRNPTSPPSALRSRKTFSTQFTARYGAPPPPFRPHFRVPAAAINGPPNKRGFDPRAIRPPLPLVTKHQRPGNPSVASVNRFLPTVQSNIPQSTNSLFSTATPSRKDHHFDTLLFVDRLKKEGFSESQAKSLMLVLSDVIEESIQNLTRSMTSREEAEQSTYTQKVDFTKLRSELFHQDSTDSAATTQAYERLGNELTKLNSKVRDDISKAQASVRLDLSLEKGRTREEAKGMETRIRETEARIEQEVARLKERVEGVKFGTLQWLV